jgi:long-chain acyl-CoA synthetase
VTSKLDLSQYESLGAALTAAIERWPEEICLIETDREHERTRLAYRDFGAAALRLAAGLKENGFAAGDRAAILMSNQSKWLISAYAIFYCGGVLVPLDYKLTPAEHLALLAHSKVRVLIVEYPIWKALSETDFSGTRLEIILVTEARAGAALDGAKRWEEFGGEKTPEFRTRNRQDAACIVYSSGTGGRPKGCVLTHENYLEQCAAVSPLWPFSPGARYLSIIPTNHAIDFMGGFIMPFTGGGTVVHLRTLRPEYIRDAFTRYKITYMAVVPLILKNLERGLRERFAALPPVKRLMLNALVRVNRLATRRRPRLWLSRLLLKDVHQAFGGQLRALLVGGAFTEPKTLELFHDLGIQIANGYGCTEACTAITVNDMRPFRPHTLGKPVAGMQIRIVNAGADGVGEVAVRSKTVMSHYLDDPELTAETIADGWLLTGDLGKIDASGHLQLFGRKKNMIVTAEGKNIYPEDIENVFEGMPAKEFCVFAANYLWPQRTMADEQLVLVVHPDPTANVNGSIRGELERRNQRLVPYKRISGYVLWSEDFPRTASLKIKRNVLAGQIGRELDRSAVQPL